MKLKFEGDIADLMEGIRILSPELGIEISDDGKPVKVIRSGNVLHVSMNSLSAEIAYGRKAHFFRGLGILAQEAAENESFDIVEEPQFDMNGAMFDVSRNAVLKAESIKLLIRKMALMGLNLLMLYTEDTYEIKNRPYFGYMRGRYSKAELKECDDYADIFGIEMMPCIQTLAHLSQALKWKFAEEFRDTDDILLAGSEKTYEFIEEMINSASSPFRSKRIHVGMDEAHMLGLGKYLKLNGYSRSYDIMLRHLKRVMEITERHGLKPMMWSDMYFRIASREGGYYDLGAVIPEDVVKNAPDGMQLVYWDYYHKDIDFYIEYIRRHKAFGSLPVFAGGLWTWAGMVINYGKAFCVTNAALEACKAEGVREVFATLWGDNGAETNMFSALLGLQLYAEHGFCRNPDEERIKKRFEFCTGGNFDLFMSLKNIDAVEGTAPDNFFDANPSKYLLWQDILSGLFDKNVEHVNLPEHFKNVGAMLETRMAGEKEWQFVFTVPAKLCSVLAVKSNIGIKTRKAYLERNIDALERILNRELPLLAERVEELRKAHREQWMKVYKPFGWDVLDIRYGGLLARIDTAGKRIKDFLSGEIDRIEELDEERLFFDGEFGPGESSICCCNIYTRIASANPI